MSKERPKFRDIWVNQTTLGKAFNLSSVAIGKKLKEVGLRDTGGSPTEKALTENYCKATPLKDGTPFFLWHQEKVKALLQSHGLASLSKQEIHCKELAESLIEVEQMFDEGQDKMAYLMQDSIYYEIRHDDVPLINRF